MTEPRKFRLTVTYEVTEPSDDVKRSIRNVLELPPNEQLDDENLVWALVSGYQIGDFTDLVTSTDSTLEELGLAPKCWCGAEATYWQCCDRAVTPGPYWRVPAMQDIVVPVCEEHLSEYHSAYSMKDTTAEPWEG